MKTRMPATLILSATLLSGIPGAGPVLASEPAREGVSPRRLALLTKGINLSHWFAQGPRGYPREHLETYDTAKDMALIRSLGFLHVRWTFNEATIQAEPGGLDAEKMKVFDAALDMMLAADLAVIVDFHTEDGYKRAIEKDDAAVERFVAMWRALAKHLATRDPERVFLEVMNEPVIRDAGRWDGIQRKVLAAMRESAPKHTLIATGPQWSSVDQLLLIRPVEDRNVVYNFHCYDPFAFTHQSAGWVGEPVRSLKDVPYPSSPEAVEKILAGMTDERAKAALRRYGEERWNVEKIDSRIARAAKWGAEHGVPVTCNEFGVYRRAPADDRARCIADVRETLEKHGIGWCMWDYAGGFAVATGKPGSRVPDPQTVEALGLGPKIDITVDTSQVPEMAEWAARAKELCLKAYPMILSFLGEEGFEPPKEARIIFRPSGGIAATSGRTITCAATWFKAHPDDYGAVVHELCHVVQAYGRSRVPGWVTEGIADYVRWFNYEPPDRRPRVNPRRAKYTDGYQTTAAFFDWIMRTKDKTFINRLNSACRHRKYSVELFQEYAGKPVDDLWAEFIASLQAR
ncbi:MAG: cellulase family glycosylhydrolase [Planctomycetes bacterium]|nr:cellulase family glycosylhydrolase [Planctomycetota bacterium]